MRLTCLADFRIVFVKKKDVKVFWCQKEEIKRNYRHNVKL